jgi:hypothetical protein
MADIFAEPFIIGAADGPQIAGGQLLNISVEAMLFAGIAMALTGTLILFFTLSKSDL